MSKLPKKLLAAPPEYLDENMTAVFKTMGYGCVPLWTNTGCALFVHVDNRTIRDCQHAVYSVRIELHEVDGCPLIRLDVKVYDRPRDPLRMDCFLNINRTDDDHLPVIEALTEQEYMVFHWYDEKLKYVRSSRIHWEEEQREATKKIITAARDIVSRTGGGDFDNAKIKFMANNPL